MNFNKECVDVDLQDAYTDLLTGDKVRGTTRLGKFGVRVLKTA